MTDQPTRTYVIASRSTDDYTGYRMVPLVSREQAEQMPRIRAAWEIAGAPSFDDAMGALLASLAGQWIGSDITITQLIPRPATADEKLDAARSALRADYWQDVQNVVANLRSLIEDGEITETDDAIRWIDDTVYGHQRVIYAGQAIECLLFSRNDSAYWDEGMAGTGEVENGNYSQLAYFAFRADVMAEIGGLEDFIDTHKPGPYGVCADCDEDVETEDEDMGANGVVLCEDCASKDADNA